MNNASIVTACRIVRSAFFSGHDDRLAVLFEELFAAVQKRGLSDEDKETYKTKFLNALVAYRHPVIFDPVEQCCCIHGIREGNVVSETEAELLTHAPYAELVQDARRRERIIGTIIDPPLLSILIAEGYVCPRTRKPRKNMVLPHKVKADLIQLGIWKGDANTTEADDSRRQAPSRHLLMEETSESAYDSSRSNQRGAGVKRKNVNDNSNSRNALYDDDSESDDFLDSQPFATHPRTKR